MSSRRKARGIAGCILRRLVIYSIVLIGLWFLALNILLIDAEHPSESAAENNFLSSLDRQVQISKKIVTKQTSELSAEAKSAAIRATDQIPGYQPLSSLIEASPSEATDSENSQKFSLKIVGDVQFLLDYVIAGFSKCGTTTLLKWIMRDPQVRTFKREIHELVNDNTGRFVERLYDNILEGPPLNVTSINNKKPFLQGFKNPEVLQTPLALQHIHNHWPETKLIVSVRNPLKWFRSFYNFRLTIGHLHMVGKDPNALIGSCGNGTKILCTHMGAFHAKLFRLGKTSMESKEELNLLRPFLSTDDVDIWNPTDGSFRNDKIPRMKNKIFFLDLRQMSDTNRTRSRQFRKDLEQFLGLEHDLTPVFRARPFKHLELSLDDESKQHKINDICDPKYLPLQEGLTHMARQASLWLRNYFLKSEDVVVSSREYLEELLETWMENQCVNNASK